MNPVKPSPSTSSAFLDYLIAEQVGSETAIPSLDELSSKLEMSKSKLREEVACARAMGIVSSKPRTGMRREPFDFLPAVLPSILFGLATGEAQFEHLSQLRRALESSLWSDAVAALLPSDIDHLDQLIVSARAKLVGSAIAIPHDEHRAFHLTIFSRLGNPFVTGVLEAYWAAYETSEFTRYQPLAYWQTVWDYHYKITAALRIGDSALGHDLLQQHFNLLNKTPAQNNGTGLYTTEKETDL